MRNGLLQKLMCIGLSALLITGPISVSAMNVTEEEVICGDVNALYEEEVTAAGTFSTAGGGHESIFATINNVADSQVTSVKYKKSDGAEAELSGDDFIYLVRDDGHYDAEGDYVDDHRVRIDIPGLAAGTYTLTVEAAGKTYTQTDINVIAYDRAGYAHFNRTEGVGAYNNDGTLKSNAKILYVTDENKNTVTFEESSGKGIGNILNDSSMMQKLTKANIPLVVRFVGYVSESEMYRKSVKDTDEYDQKNTYHINGLSKYAEKGDNYGSDETNGHMAKIQNAKDLTLEGIGTDATIDGWGFCFKPNADNNRVAYGTSFEVRNLTFINTAEDAIGMEGSNVTYRPVKNCWIHNNSFYCPHLKYCSDMRTGEKDKYEGDGTIDFKLGFNLTVADNYFYETHKTSLIGGNDDQYQMNLTYHHNYFDRCISRLPLARHANIHMYNNWFSHNTGTTINPGANCYVFSELNLFDNTVSPKLRDSTAAIKSWSDWYENTSNGDAKIVSSKTDTVANNCECNGTDYSRFDTNSTLSYIPSNGYYTITNTADLKDYIENYSGVAKDVNIAGNEGGDSEGGKGDSTSSSKSTSSSSAVEKTEMLFDPSGMTEVTDAASDIVYDKNFTVKATSGKTVSVIGQETSLDVDSKKITVTKNLNLRGGGSKEYRCVKFSISSPSEIFVAASGKDSRYLTLDSDIEDYEKAAKNTSETVTVYTYKADKAGTYYLYSSTSAIAIYYIKINSTKADTDDKSTSTSGSSGSDIEDAGIADNNTDVILDYAKQMREANIKSDYKVGGFTWDTEAKNVSWTYYNGLMLDSFMDIGKSDDIAYVDSFYNQNIASDGSVYGLEGRLGQLDSVEPARPMFDLLDSSDNADKYKAAIQKVYSMLENQHSYEECGGNYLHKQQSDGTPVSSWSTYTIALDGLYMAQPFLMECANAIDKGKLTLIDKSGDNVSSADIYADVYNRLVWIYENMYDSTDNLYMHGYNTSAKADNGVCWSRAYGWYAMALTDVIEMMPADTDEHLAMRKELMGHLPRVLDSIISYQDAEAGMWKNVLTKSSVANNRFETSGSAMFTYSLLKAYVKGYVSDAKYGNAGVTGFNSIVENKVTGTKGNYSVADIYKSSGVTSSASAYCDTSKYVLDEAKGTGPLIMAAVYMKSAIAKLAGDDKKPGDTGSSSEKPGDTSDTTVKPGDTSDTTEKPRDTSNTAVKPGDTSNTAVKPGDTSNTAVKPGDTSDTTVKPGDTSDTTVKPGDTSSTVAKPEDTSSSMAAAKNSSSEKTTKSGESIPEKIKETIVVEKGKVDDAEHLITVEQINTYTGSKIMPDIDFVIKTADGMVYDKAALSKKDYKIIYKNNKNANMEYDAQTRTFKRKSISDDKQPYALIVYSGRLKGLKSDTVKYDIYPSDIDDISIFTYAKGNVLRVKAGKKLKIYKKASVVMKNGKRKMLNRKKDIISDSIKLVPIVNNLPDLQAAGIRENMIADASMNGDYVLVVTGQGNYYSTMWSDQITLRVE